MLPFAGASKPSNQTRTAVDFWTHSIASQGFFVRCTHCVAVKIAAAPGMLPRWERNGQLALGFQGERLKWSAPAIEGANEQRCDWTSGAVWPSRPSAPRNIRDHTIGRSGAIAPPSGSKRSGFRGYE